jgi:hypothetical protein
MQQASRTGILLNGPSQVTIEKFLICQTKVMSLARKTIFPA